MNIKLTDSGIVDLETLLVSYKEELNSDDKESVQKLLRNIREAMSKAHTGQNPMSPQEHIVEMPEDIQPIKKILEEARTKETRQRKQVARDVLYEIE